MIKSMTGYGLSSSIQGSSEVSVEIKGVNHRFLEISLKSNEISNDIDQYIRNIVGKNIIRGKVDIKIKFKSPSESKYFIDTKLLKNLKKSIKDNLGIEEHLKFSDIKDIPGILNIESKKSINNTFLKREFNKALKDFTDSRNKEGMKIKKVIDKKIQGIEILVTKIIKKSYKKPDDPIFKETFKTFTLKKNKVEDTYDKTLPSCNTKRFDE